MQTIIKKALIVLVIVGITSFVVYRYFLTSELPAKPDKKPTKQSNLVLISIDDLSGFGNDDMSGAIDVNKKSCSVFLKLPKNKQVGTKYIPITAGDMILPCKKLQEVNNANLFKQWLNTYFDVYAVYDDKGNNSGKITGYFEAELQGSLSPTAKYKYPIYALPKDMFFLKSRDWSQFGVKHNLVGMIKGQKFIPYYKREQIDAINMNAPILAYAQDKTDVFLLHIQGSGRIVLDSGKVVRLGYAGNNGHKYKSLGGELIKNGHLTLSQASWKGIRTWINNNPQLADKMLGVNARYIFFKYINKSSGGPIGKMGVGLTPKRSLAVDYKKIPMGLNIWLDAEGLKQKRIRRLMNTQDTGVAITGWIRGDFFWGYGNKALKYAGRMNSSGKYYIFLPKSIKNNIIK